MEFCSTSVDPKMPSVDVPNRNPKCAHEQGRTLSAAMAGMGLVTTKARAQEGTQSGHEHAEIWESKSILQVSRWAWGPWLCEKFGKPILILPICSHEKQESISRVKYQKCQTLHPILGAPQEVFCRERFQMINLVPRNQNLVPVFKSEYTSKR